MKILIIAGNDRSLITFRGPLIRALTNIGHEVVACAPEETRFVTAQLAAAGARFAPIRFARAGLNPVSDVLSMRRMDALFKRERPDVLLLSTIKPVVHGVISARRTGVSRVYALVTGLGTAFHTPGLKGRLLSLVATWLYRRALRHCTHVLVQNGDIAKFFLERGIIDDLRRLTVVPGSGVDIAHFAVKPFPTDTAPCFLFLGRFLKNKGVGEYVEAAREVRRRLPTARFLLVGDLDPNPTTITAVELEQWKAEGIVEPHPFTTDVRPYLERCTVCVLPSYHEGMPRGLLEAMATARAIITTDTIGCRDTIFGIDRAAGTDSEFRTGENGLLVPVKSASALAAAMLHLAQNAQLAEAMGRRGRELAEEHFDVRNVNALMLETMGLMPQDKNTKPELMVGDVH